MFLPLVEKRRSVRKFEDKQVEPEKIDQLVEAALRAPSSRAGYPWEFVVVSDKRIVEKLSRSKANGSVFLKDAPLAIVVCADPDKSDVWIEDTSIATIFIHLAAASLGLGSCWIQIRKRNHDDTKPAEAYIQETLNIPTRIRVESIVAVGYPGEEKPPHRKEKLLYEQVHFNAYGQKQSA